MLSRIQLTPRGPRTWRTRTDPLGAAWVRAEVYLRAAPELEATALFEHLLETAGEALLEGQLPTFQRRVRQWRLEHGPDPEVIFAQEHRPGEVLQVDWTHAKELGVTIAGQPLDHRFCHVVLPYSNWQWATRCQSEWLLSVRQGLQAALHRLGKVPGQLQIDNSSAATHQISVGGKRAFNTEFLSLVEHYGLVPRTIGIQCPNQNGDVESHNGHLKQRLLPHLLLRGSRDFASEGDYDRFVEDVLLRANAPHRRGGSWAWRTRRIRDHWQRCPRRLDRKPSLCLRAASGVEVVLIQHGWGVACLTGGLVLVPIERPGKAKFHTERSRHLLGRLPVAVGQNPASLVAVGKEEL